MRKPNIILQEIQDLDSIITNTKELIPKFPDDKLLILTIEQAENRKIYLLQEFEKSLAIHRRHSIKFIFTNVKENLGVESLVGNLQTFKILVDRTFEHILCKKRNKIPIYFNTVFSGSFGIYLSTPYDSEFFSVHDDAFEFIINTINEILQSEKSKVRDIIKSKFKDDKKLIRKYNNFFKNVVETQESVKIEWKSPNKKEEILNLEYEKAQKLYNLFSEHEKYEEVEIELFGIVKGISLIHYFIEFKKDLLGKQVIKIRFDKSLSEKVIPTFNMNVIAKITQKIELNEITEEEIKAYSLIDINIQNNQPPS